MIGDLGGSWGYHVQLIVICEHSLGEGKRTIGVADGLSAADRLQSFGDLMEDRGRQLITKIPCPLLPGLSVHQHGFCRCRYKVGRETASAAAIADMVCSPESRILWAASN